MSDWHPIVYRLGKIDPLPGSDFLEITTIMGEYPAILKKGQYKENQLASFLPYDTIVPDNEYFHFLAKPIKRDKNGNVLIPPPNVGSVPLKDRTIKARKIRGFYSDCLIVDAPLGFSEGDSIIDYFGLTKREYEEELPEKGSNDNEVAPKTFSLFKYELEGLAKYGYVFEENEPVIICEKLDGQNFSLTYLEDKLWVRSRNFFKRESNDSIWWNIPHRLNLSDKLKNYPGLTIWGELYGAIKGWKYDCEVIDNRIQVNFRVFDIFDIKNRKFLSWDEVVKISSEIELKTAPVLYRGPWKNDRSLHNLAEGKSTIGDCIREGWVMRSELESFHPKLGRKIVKLKGKGYKLIKG